MFRFKFGTPIYFIFLGLLGRSFNLYRRRGRAFPIIVYRQLGGSLSKESIGS